MSFTVDSGTDGFGIFPLAGLAVNVIETAKTRIRNNGRVFRDSILIFGEECAYKRCSKGFLTDSSQGFLTKPTRPKQPHFKQTNDAEKRQYTPTPLEKKAKHLPGSK